MQKLRHYSERVLGRVSVDRQISALRARERKNISVGMKQVKLWLCVQMP